MELIAVIFMILAGGAIAAFILIAVAIARRESPEPSTRMPADDRDRIAASLLFQLALLGGASPDQALRAVRRSAGLAAPVTAAIDMASWGEQFARIAPASDREWLLETAVRIVASPGRPVPLHQYTALLDLSFALGFQTDALAKLRDRYGFEFIDHARNARPRYADRAGGGAPLYVRNEADPAELLRILGVEGEPSRQTIISAYRRLAAQYHPDRFHEKSQDAQADAAARFIEITRAYEMLLAIYRE